MQSINSHNIWFNKMSIFICCASNLTFCFIFIAYLLNTLLRNFDNFWLSFVNEVTRGTYNFVSLIVKIILLESALVLSFSLPRIDKTLFFTHLSFNSTLQLINDSSSDLQKLVKYFTNPAIVAFYRLPLAWFNNWFSLILKKFKFISIHNIIIKVSCFIIWIKP